MFTARPSDPVNRRHRARQLSEAQPADGIAASIEVRTGASSSGARAIAPQGKNKITLDDCTHATTGITGIMIRPPTSVTAVGIGSPAVRGGPAPPIDATSGPPRIHFSNASLVDVHSSA